MVTTARTSSGRRTVPADLAGGTTVTRLRGSCPTSAGDPLSDAVPTYAIGIAYAVMCIAITWWRYARPGAPKPS